MILYKINTHNTMDTYTLKFFVLNSLYEQGIMGHDLFY